MPEPLVVFDCVVFVQGLIRKFGPAVTCIERFQKGDFSLAISKETLAELREVISRSTLQERFPLLTEEKAAWLIELLLYKGKIFQHVPRRFEYHRDPDDEPYINLAIEAGADFLVTRDADLLDLMDWSKEEGRNFQKRFRNLRILDPVTFLKELG